MTKLKREKLERIEQLKKESDFMYSAAYERGTDINFQQAALLGTIAGELEKLEKELRYE